jgi:hypothetical protein
VSGTNHNGERIEDFVVRRGLSGQAFERVLIAFDLESLQHPSYHCHVHPDRAATDAELL